MIQVKICGLTRLLDIDIVNEAMPDYIGFVFAESRRKVMPGQAKSLRARLDPRIKAVGVFVNADLDDIERAVSDGAIDIVQLHGDEDAAYIEGLKNRIGNLIIKAVRVQSPRQVTAAQALPCDMLLLDTFQKGAYGGTGKTFDYTLVPPLNKPFFLAGGLDAQNIRAALDIQPYSIDISGGVETNGIKDAEKIREIVEIIRSQSADICKTGEQRSPVVG